MWGRWEVRWVNWRGSVWEMGGGLKGECVGNGGVEEGCVGGWEKFVGGRGAGGLR